MHPNNHPAYHSQAAKDTANHPGMTLRDYFAAKALQAVPMPQGHMHDHREVYDRIASHCYKMADAMLRAREAV
jgi:hypothetical protein